ncbi:MAG: HAMP domain-containing sensor histidine kinase [Polyangiales bacterium]
MSRSLVGRVSRAMTLVAALTALGAALLANTLAWRSAIAREDARLRGAAATMVRELARVSPERLGDEADDEAAEIAPEGMRIALWERGTRLGGAEGERPGPEGCASLGARRRCTVPAGPRSVVVSSGLEGMWSARRSSAWAALAAALLASLAAYAASRGVAARVVGPLSRLRASVDRLDADAPDARSLSAAEGYDEVDALHGALAELVGRHADALSTARRFSADAAHELRTPLGTMRAELELAAETPGIHGEVTSALARVGASLAAVSALSERLLILASPHDGARLGREAVSLAEVVSQRVEALDEARRARVEVSADEELLVRGDAVLLGALAENVIDNALKFSDGAVRVSVAREGGAAVLRVRDEGPGVAPEERARAFEPFFRSARARAGGQRGHGVGLALVAHVARAHGATARFEDVDLGASIAVSFAPWSEAG